jgi:hypothetical protein
MGLAIDTFDRCLHERSIHALDLPIGSGMLRFAAALLDGVLLAGIGEGVPPKEQRRNRFDLLFC